MMSNSSSFSTVSILHKIEDCGEMVHPSFFERLIFSAYAVVAAVLACASPYILFVKHPADSAPSMGAVLFSAALIPSVLLGMALLLLRRCFLAYRFQADTISCLGLFGGVVWREPTETFVSFQRLAGVRGPGRVRLVWPDRSHTIPFDAWWFLMWIDENARSARKAGYKVPPVK